MAPSEPDAEVAHIAADECWRILASMDVGRISLVHDGYPVVFPVNFRVAQRRGSSVIAIRTRRGNVIDHPGRPAAFEVDWVDADRRGGGSVLVRGRLVSIEADPEFDSHPIVADGRDAWLALVPVSTTGRLVMPPVMWVFHPAAYL